MQPRQMAEVHLGILCIVNKQGAGTRHRQATQGVHFVDRHIPALQATAKRVVRPPAQANPPRQCFEVDIKRAGRADQHHGIHGQSLAYRMQGPRRAHRVRHDRSRIRQRIHDSAQTANEVGQVTRLTLAVAMTKLIKYTDREALRQQGRHPGRQLRAIPAPAMHEHHARPAGFTKMP